MGYPEFQYCACPTHPDHTNKGLIRLKPHAGNPPSHTQLFVPQRSTAKTQIGQLPRAAVGLIARIYPQGLPGYSLFHLKLQFHRHSTFKVNLSFKEKRSGLILPRLARISRARSEERFNISLRQVRALSTWTYCLLVHEHELITIYVYLWKSV